MEEMNLQTMTKKVHHSITCDGSEIELTQFVEYINKIWYKEYHSLFQFENVTWDNGHDVLRFETTSGKVSIVKYIQKLSEIFPTMFYMYDYYTASTEDEHEEGVFWLYEGTATTSKEELFKEE